MGNWSLKFPSNTLTSAQNEVSINSQPGYAEPLKINLPLKVFNSESQPDIYVQAIGGDNLLYKR